MPLVFSYWDMSTKVLGASFNLLILFEGTAATPIFPQLTKALFATPTDETGPSIKETHFSHLCQISKSLENGNKG